MDGDGDIYVADWMNYRVQVFTPEFRYVTHFRGDATISKWGEQALRANPDYLRMYGLLRDMSRVQRFWYPTAVELDQQDRVIIADANRHPPASLREGRNVTGRLPALKELVNRRGYWLK